MLIEIYKLNYLRASMGADKIVAFVNEFVVFILSYI